MISSAKLTAHCYPNEIGEKPYHTCNPLFFVFFPLPLSSFLHLHPTHTHSHTHKIKLIKINKKERRKRTDHRLIRPTHRSTIGKSYFRQKTLTWRLKPPATHKFRNSPPLVVATVFFTNSPPSLRPANLLTLEDSEGCPEVGCPEAADVVVSAAAVALAEEEVEELEEAV